MLPSLVPTIATILLVFLIDFAAAGNTTCAGNMTQWYTDAVGETACTTYQKLRQICNPNYQVPNFRQNTPGDQCDDQLQSCCCNSISWALSMLCMNCQWDVNGGSVSGIDAGTGAYGMYRSPSGPFCTPGTNSSLPSDIQAAVCNKDIKLANFLYDLFWNDGSWYYIYTMNTGVKDEAATNNNMYTHCNSTTSSTLSSSTSTSTTSAAPSQTTTTASAGSTQKSNTNIAIIIGPVIGGLIVLIGTVVIARFYWRKRRISLERRISLDTDSPYAYTMAMVSPYTVTDPDNFSSTSPPISALASTTSMNGQSSSDLLGNSASALRHEDAGVVPNLTRSHSGRLPPAYNPGWEAPNGESSQLNPGSEFQAEEPSRLQITADSEPRPRRTKS
ncbi:hypothetical protein BDR03DRAFT_940527 [Suillus americanus]|nr:hypothetical protein BDR03DRAFT_940527 [Suillus americanus]